MRPDEVYQAAFAAGSGGIRWNSEEHYIQLADENRIWHNYKYWNHIAPFELVSDNRSGNIAYIYDDKVSSGQLKANNKYFYFDYKNGKYGYNTSSSRGADTFSPFNEKPTGYLICDTIYNGNNFFIMNLETGENIVYFGAYNATVTLGNLCTVKYPPSNTSNDLTITALKKITVTYCCNIHRGQDIINTNSSKIYYAFDDIVVVPA